MTLCGLTTLCLHLPALLIHANFYKPLKQSSVSPQEGARLTSFVQQQQPGLLQQVMGPGGPPGSTGAKMAVAGVVAFAAKQMLGSGSGLGGFKL